ncbi:MAG: LysR family transcriptional regulator [Alphaproteobacteria bacterium]|nr:LysR family transcriptional regulator [Alphaproteobacteria bacterium]
MSLFVTVAETGGFSAASRKLGMPLPTVSRKISELETYLKVRLLNRSTRRLELTESGKSYLAACKRIIDEVHEAERVAANEYTAPKGELMITAPIWFGRLHLLPVVIDFLKAYPDIDVGLMLTDRVVSLLEEHVDLALRIGALPDSSMMAIRLGAIRQVVCASPAYLEAHGTPKTPMDLLQHHCIMMQVYNSTPWTFTTGSKTITVPVRARLTVSTAEAAIDAAVGGIGITRVLSYQMAAMQKAGKLVTLLDAFEPAVLPVSMLYMSGRILPLKLRAFLDFAIPRLRAQVAPF